MAQDERLSHFLNRSLLDPSDDRVIEEMPDAKGPGGFSFRDLGMTAEALRVQLAHRKEHEEEPADCLVVKAGPQNETTYCAVCATEILTKAHETLGELHRAFPMSKQTETFSRPRWLRCPPQRARRPQR